MHPKRLITVFDEKPDIVLFETDVIVTNNASYCDNSHQVIYITNSDIIDKDKVLMQRIKEALNSLPEEFQVVQNNIYHRLLRPIVHTLVMIERIIEEKEIEEIFLFGGSKVTFLSLSNSEGEGIKKIYHSSWLFNPIINQYFRENRKIDIIWHNRKICVSHAMLYWYREKYYFLRRAVGYSVRDLMGKEKAIPYLDRNKKIIIALADLELQYKHIVKRVEEFIDYEKLYVLGRGVTPASEDKACRLPSLSISSIIEIVRKIRRARAKDKRVFFQLNGHIVNLHAHNLMMGSKERLFIALYQKKALSQLIQTIGPGRINCICTNRTMGADICFVQNVCKEYKILHVNFQYVAMLEILYPNMNVADRYYLYSRKVYELYKDYGKQFNFYLPLDKNCFSERSDQAHRIVIFTQPDTYTDRYLDAIRAILKCFTENDSQVEILIKLHYRQDKIDDFISCEQYYAHAKVLTTGNAGEVMNDCDCVISMTSSVLFEAMLKGIPTMIIDFDGRDKAVIEGSDVCVPEVNYVVHSPYEIINLLNNYSLFYHDYRKRLEKYMHNANVQDNIVDDFLKASETV